MPQELDKYLVLAQVAVHGVSPEDARREAEYLLSPAEEFVILGVDTP